MEWNPQKQEYCKYWRSFGGTFKAPEEVRRILAPARTATKIQKSLTNSFSTLSNAV
jgi:hypothetical protein